jgi:hypothetical protein
MYFFRANLTIVFLISVLVDKQTIPYKVSSGSIKNGSQWTHKINCDVCLANGTQVNVSVATITRDFSVYRSVVP